MPLNEELPERVDVLIIGSGFGGSVMAKELAGKGHSVCLVERGKAYPPGSFPRDPAGVSRNFWDPKAGLHGMFDVWSFTNMDAVIASGLGGGSLIYANVMLPKDATWFKQKTPDGTSVEDWALQRSALDEHYAAVREYLRVEEFPHDTADETVPAEFRLAKTTRFLQNTIKANIRKPRDGVGGKREMDAAAEDLYDKPVSAIAEIPGHFGGYAPLAVRFRDEDGNLAVGAPLPPEAYGSVHGTPLRTTCTMVGECDVGCNQGAKNTLDHTYLSDASAQGVSIHTSTEVVGLRRLYGEADLFEATLQIHRSTEENYTPETVEQRVPGYGTRDQQMLARDRSDAAVDDAADIAPLTRPIRARRVVVAAGTLGTTFLLLRNEDALAIPYVTDRGDPTKKVLGSRFSGNGDFLAFVRNAFGRLDCTRGPVITAYRRYDAETDPEETDPDAPDGAADSDNADRHGMYIQDAGIPAFAAWLVQLAQAPAMVKNAARVFAQRKLDGDDSNLSAELNKILVNGEYSAKFMPLLGMGRDQPTGTFSLTNRGTRLRCDWGVDPSESYYKKMKERMATIARGFSGSLLSNPLYEWPFHRGITVHPVGGCPMDTTLHNGIVDTYGRLRGVDGLRVCDGSVFPGPIGPNPSLTIAAFARRSAHNLLEEKDFAKDPTPADPYAGS